MRSVQKSKRRRKSRVIMNKRQIKKFCKKGGHYHFDKTLKRISRKSMFPFVANTIGHMIAWCKMGTCLTCEHCTSVVCDTDGTPYMVSGRHIGCGGADNFTCKRYRLDPDIPFFKYQNITNKSEDSELKRYIDNVIESYNGPDSHAMEMFLPQINIDDFEDWVNGIRENEES